ncbi:helix-turn-helix transcriptional regulator [Streptomyces sp. HF10]|uniref:helix-turn-helix transcriptional regulator n=1 Tax=Streptomyces sp. HF10 TaxID=2692233 RepID=UPI00131691D6|nr:LuxR C-terminal-related transcriptional regulator [Streptomyces sp. HF10]QHC28140.1 helix-turn-helix transcriptional regulator [Streptomyces sp. HF10]
MVVTTMGVPDETGADPHGPADPCGDPFLRTRFAIPALPATHLRRDRLLGHLDAAPRTPLTVVGGAAGAGKTLLVADWAATRGTPVAWLTAQMADKGHGTFWAYLLQALRLAGVTLSAEVGLPAEAGRVDDALLTRLAVELGARAAPVTAVIDEYDRVTDPEIADQLEFVLRHAGTGVRLVLVTRTEPLLPLHRYRAAGAVTEIRNDELAFTPEEAGDLLALHGLRLPPDEIGALLARTRGWAAGLRLSALAAQGERDPRSYLKEFEADRTTIGDYLIAEVLKRQRAETQDLLLRISVLDRFGPALADALTGRADAELILTALHRENAFVEDLGYSWFRLHPLFREILRAHLRARHPGLETELHRRAAAWLRRHGPLGETLEHAAAAGDREAAAGALVGDLALGELLTGPRAEPLAALFCAMGSEPRTPATDLVRAARALSLGDLDRALPHLERATRELEDVATRPVQGPDGPGREQHRERGDPGEVAAARLGCALLQVLAARLAGSPSRAEAAARRAEELTREVPGRLLDRHPELTALLRAHLGAARLWAGRFTQARAALTAVTDHGRTTPAASAQVRAPEPASPVGTRTPAAPGRPSTAQVGEECLAHLALLDHLDGRPGRAERKALAALAAADHTDPSVLPGVGPAALVLAAVATERDELDRAEALLDAPPDAADARQPVRDPVARALHTLVTARLLLARGDTEGALEAADRTVAAEEPSPWAEAHAALVAAGAHLADGRPELAVKLLTDLPGEDPLCLVGAAQAELAAGRPAHARDLLARLRPQSAPGPLIAVRSALVRAELAGAEGDREARRRFVAQALREARRDRLRRPFKEAGPWLRPLLATPALRPLAEGWLLPGAGSPDGTAAVPEPPPVIEELSGRERDVLVRLAEMMSTEEIAADLFVSVNTVKTHLKSAYRKLGVNRRHDAVHRARELGLL